MTKLKELIGIMKDKASQGKAAIFSRRTTLSLLRATSHDSFTPPTHNHLSTLLSSGDGSRATASAVIDLLMDRLQRTHSSAVALKCLITVHHIIKHGAFILKDQVSLCPYAGGRNNLNLSNFRDKSTSLSWQLSSWVRWYAKHVEQLLCTSRIVGFFLGAATPPHVPETQEERTSGLTNGDLLTEMDALLTIIEGIRKIPDPGSIEGNKLVCEIGRLVEEDGVAALSEVCVRVKELKERLEFLSFGEGVELVYALKRLEECRERMTMMMMMMEEMAQKRRLWDCVKELKEKVEMKQVYREENKMVTRHRATRSDRLALTHFNSLHFPPFTSPSFL